MPSELTCVDCGKQATVELREKLQLGDEVARLYFPAGELDEEVPLQMLLNAERTFYERPATGTAFCSPCMVRRGNDDMAPDDLGRLEDGHLRFENPLDGLTE